MLTLTVEKLGHATISKYGVYRYITRKDVLVGTIVCFFDQVM